MDFLDYVKMCQEETSSGNGSERRGSNMPDGNRRPEGNRLPEDKRRPDPMGGPSCRGQIYKVQRGDTLYSISRKYNLRVRDLMQANPFVNVYQLQVGEELCIPVIPGNQQGPGVQPYVVKREDTVLSILNNNNISFQELARLNKSAQVLKFPAGTVLLLPQRTV